MTDIMKQYNQLQRAYEAQAEENADLALLADQYKAERDALQAENGAVRAANIDCKLHFDTLKADYDTLQAKLDELQRQEPIGFVIKDSDYTNSIIREQGGHHTQPVYAAPKALEPLTESIQWIVNDLGELGVKAGNRFMFLYKGDSIEYGEDDIGTAKHSDGTPMKYRIVGKREFGEVCHPLKWIANNRKESRYTEELVFTPGLSFGTPEDGKWRELPAAIESLKEQTP